MPENIFTRTGRYIGAAIEEGLDRLEEMSGPALMRQAVREASDAIEKLEHERDEAMKRLELALAATDDARTKMQEWTEKAKFAVSKGRGDLAEAALEMQQDSEKMAEAFSGISEIARTEAELLKTALQDMTRQKEDMQRELAEFLKDRRQAELKETFEKSARTKIRAILDKAESVMETVSNSRRADESDTVVDSGTSEKSADIDEQLARLKKEMAAKRAK